MSQVVGHPTSELQVHIGDPGAPELPPDEGAMLHWIASVGGACIARHAHLLDAQPELRSACSNATADRLTEIKHETMSPRG